MPGPVAVLTNGQENKKNADTDQMIQNDSLFQKQGENNPSSDEDKSLNNKEWTKRIMKICNKEITLTYPNLSENQAHSTEEYKMEDAGTKIDTLKLEEGISIKLSSASVLETDMRENADGKVVPERVYFLSPGGQIEFDLSKIKGMEDVTGKKIFSGNKISAKLGMFQLVSIYGNGENKQVEINAYLSDTLKVSKKTKGGKKENIELVQGEYQKPAVGDGMLKFADAYLVKKSGRETLPQITEIYFHDNENVDEKEVKDEYFYKAFNSTAFSLKDAQRREEGVSAGWAKTEIGKFQIELEKVFFEDYVMTAQEGSLLISSTPMKLHTIAMKEKSNELTAEKAEGELWGEAVSIYSVETNKNDTLKATKAEVKIHGEEGTIYGIGIDRERKLTATSGNLKINGFDTTVFGFQYTKEKGITYNSATVNVGLNFGKKEKINGEETITTVNLEGNQRWQFTLEDYGEFGKNIDDNIKSKGYFATSRIERTKKVTKDVTEEDKKKKTSKRRILQRLKQKQQEEKEKKVQEGSKKQTGKKAPKAKIKRTEVPDKILEDDIYTLDGFAKVENATFEFEKEEKHSQVVGQGNVKIQEIPVFLHYEGKTEVKKRTAFEPEDAVEKVEFTIDSSGNLNAVFEDDAEAELNMKKIGKKENSGESIIYTITLSDLSIQNGYLKVGSAKVKRGLKLAQEGFKKSEDGDGEEKDDADDILAMSKTAKKFFDCEISGDIVNQGTNEEGKEEKVKMTAQGIEAHLGTTKFGKVGVEGFMGFLSGEVDFQEGTIAVGAEHSVEPEKLQESFFKLEKNTPKVKATIPTGIPALGVGFDMTPSVGIGGSVGLSLDFGGPFSEWENGKEVEIEGEIEGEGKVGVELGASLKFGTDFLASIDLRLAGGLSAGIEGNLSGKAGLQYNKDAEKVQQSKDFEFDGSLKGSLTGTVNVSSTAKFLFWQKKVFDIELWKKELGTFKIAGAGKKEKKDKGLFSGWKLTSTEFSAGWFGQQIANQYYFGKEKDGGQEDSVLKEEKFQEILNSCKDEAQNAWAVLCKLEAQETDTVLVTDKKEKDALSKQIQEAAGKVVEKIKAYINVLEQQKQNLEPKLENAKQDYDKKVKDAEEYAQQQGLAKDVFEKASWGGYKRENYLQRVIPKNINKKDYADLESSDKTKKADAKKKFNADKEAREQEIKEAQWHNKYAPSMAAIDLMISYMLGNVSEQNLQRILKNYKGDTSDPRFHKFLFEGGTRFIDIGKYANEYKDQQSYYNILMEKAVYTRYTDPDQNDEFLDKNIYKFERTLDNFPEKIRKIIENKKEQGKSINMKEILEYILTNHGPNGEFLKISPKEKLQYLKDMFGILPEAVKVDGYTRSWLWEKNIREYGKKNIHTGLFDATGQLFKDIFSNGDTKSQDLETIVKGKNLFDIFKTMEEKNRKVEKSKAAVEEARQQVEKIQADITLVRNQIEENKKKMKAAKEKASAAVENKAFDSQAARDAINLYSEHYLQKMKGDNLKNSLDYLLQEKNKDIIPQSVSKN